MHIDMIPYPRIHMMTGSMAPLIPAEQAITENLSVTELADAAYSNSNILSSI